MWKLFLNKMSYLKEMGKLYFADRDEKGESIPCSYRSANVLRPLFAH